MKYINRQQLSSRTTCGNESNRSSLQKFSRELVVLKLQNNTEKQNRKRKKQRLKKVQLCIQNIKKMIELCQQRPVSTVPSMPLSFASTPPIVCPFVLPSCQHSINVEECFNKNSRIFQTQLPEIGQMTYKKWRKSSVQTQDIEHLNYKNSILCPHRKLKLNKKTCNKTLMRKFRVAVIAVYFAIVFPAFSRKFGQLKFQRCINRFGNKMLLQNLRSQMQTKIVQDTDSLDYYARDAQLKSLPLFVAKFISQLHQKLTNKSTLHHFGQIFAVGMTNGQYISKQDCSMYCNEQMPFLQIKKKFNQYIQLSVSQHASVALLLIRIFIEIVIGSYIRRAMDQMKDIHEMIKQSLIFLHEICKEMYMNGLKNIHELNSTEPSQIYQNQNAWLFNQEDSSSNYKMQKTSQQNFLNNLQKSNTTSIRIDSSHNLFPAIGCLQNYKLTRVKVLKNRELQQMREQITERMLKITLKIRQHLQKSEKQVYNQVWEATLRQKSLLTPNQRRVNEQINASSIKRTKHRRYRSQNNEQSMTFEQKATITGSSRRLVSRADRIRNRGSRSQKRDNFCSIKTLQSQYQMTDMSSNHRIHCNITGVQ